MTIKYRYQTDIYNAKYKVIGKVDYASNVMYIEQTELIYYDLLPKGLNWCFGRGTLNILRNPYYKKNYLDGYMTTNCGQDQQRFVLIKQ